MVKEGDMTFHDMFPNKEGALPHKFAGNSDGAFHFLG